MAKSNGGEVFTDVFNQSTNKDPNSPDTNGDGLYMGGWPEVMKMNLKESGDMYESANSKASEDVYGKNVPGEPTGYAKGGK